MDGDLTRKVVAFAVHGVRVDNINGQGQESLIWLILFPTPDDELFIQIAGYETLADGELTNTLPA